MDKSWTVSYVKTEDKQPIPRPVRPRPAVSLGLRAMHAAREKLVQHFARKISDINRDLRTELASSVRPQPSSHEIAASKVCQPSVII